MRGVRGKGGEGGEGGAVGGRAWVLNETDKRI